MTMRVRAFDSMRASSPGVPKGELLKTFYISLMLAASAAVAQPAAAQGAPQSMQATGGLTIFPKNSQTAEQQSADRYACYTWATKQANFDPSAPPSGLSASQQSTRLGEYRRAMTACLTARGYSVQSPAAAAPAAPPPPPAYTPHYITPVLVQNYPPPSPELRYHPFEFQIDGGYTIAAGKTDQDLHGGANAGLGFTYFPSANLPIGLRVDGSYSWFGAKSPLLTENGGNFSFGNEHIYGGDTDLQFDLAHGSHQKLYLFGGYGWYKVQTDLKQVGLESGVVCGFYFCRQGHFFGVTDESNTTSPWERAWNAGIGWQVAIAPRASFFLEARYQHFLPKDTNMQFVPITAGFRL